MLLFLITGWLLKYNLLFLFSSSQLHRWLISTSIVVLACCITKNCLYIILGGICWMLWVIIVNWWVFKFFGLFLSDRNYEFCVSEKQNFVPVEYWNLFNNYELQAVDWCYDGILLLLYYLLLLVLFHVLMVYCHVWFLSCHDSLW